MRVARRVRPSQVGYGASVGRRRIYASWATSPANDPEKASLPRMTLVIEQDGQILDRSAIIADGIADFGVYSAEPELTASSARGQ